MVLGQALSYKTKRFSKANFNLRVSRPYADAEIVGIIFSNDSPEKSKLIENLKALFKKDNKQIKVLAYDRNVDVKHLPFESFSKKDISFWGNFNNQAVDNFAKMPFDFLICLDNNPGKIIKNLLAKSKAKCRVGICEDFEAYRKLFELIIHNSDNSNLVDSVYAYTKNIR